MHMNFAYEVIRVVKDEQPELFDRDLEDQVREMLREAVECEVQFAEDVLGLGVTGMSVKDTRTYLESVADNRLAMLGMAPEYGSENPFQFMELQDVGSLTNFFERTVSAYQRGIDGDVEFGLDF